MDFIEAYEKLNYQERELVKEHQLRADQLRNFRGVLMNCTPKKYDKLSKETLPGYITREMNARNAAEKVMKKYGFIPR